MEEAAKEATMETTNKGFCMKLRVCLPVGIACIQIARRNRSTTTSSNSWPSKSVIWHSGYHLLTTLRKRLGGLFRASYWNLSIEMAKPVALITSATSRNGSQAAKLLLAQGKHTVRLAARDPSKLAALVSEGAEAIALDPTSAESMTKACTGVDSVYLILPTLVADAEITMFRNFLQAALSTGVKHIVYLSAIDAVPADNAAFKPVHNHYAHEQQLLTSGIAFTSLRPAWFHENQVMYHGDEIKHTGEFKTSAGDGVWTTVAVQDIAAAAVVVLSDPDAHDGKIYTLMTDAVTDGMIAAIVSKVTGQKVRHVNLTPEEHQEMLVKVFGDGSAAEERATGLVTLDSEKRGNLFSQVHPDLEELLGHKGVSLEDFLAQHADAFKQA